MSGLQISIILFSASMTLFGFFITLCLVGTITADKRAVTKRMTKLFGKKRITLTKDDKKQLKPRKNSKLFGKNEKGRKTPFSKKLLDIIFDELMAASIMMKPEEFCTIWVAITFIPSGLIALLSKQIIPAVAITVFCAIGPIIFIKSKQKKRTKQFESQLGDALIIICNCLRSGLSFQQAMETISKEMEAPIGAEFARVVNEINLGCNLEDALDKMVERVKSADLMIAISAVNVQRQTGGNLSEILETISETIKDRIKIKAEISAMTSQGRMSGLIIGVLPIALGGLLLVISPDYMEMFFTEPAGGMMLVAAAVLEILGFAMINKITNIKY